MAVERASGGEELVSQPASRRETAREMNARLQRPSSASCRSRLLCRAPGSERGQRRLHHRFGELWLSSESSTSQTASVSGRKLLFTFTTAFARASGSAEDVAEAVGWAGTAFAVRRRWRRATHSAACVLPSCPPCCVAGKREIKRSRSSAIVRSGRSRGQRGRGWEEVSLQSRARRVKLTSNGLLEVFLKWLGSRKLFQGRGGGCRPPRPWPSTRRTRWL